MSEFIYTNINAHSFKIWGYEVHLDTTIDEVIIVLYWGRIGLSMNSLRKDKKFYCSKEKAYRYIKHRIKKRQSKAYKRIKNSDYFKLIENKEPLSAVVKFIEENSEEIIIQEDLSWVHYKN